MFVQVVVEAVGVRVHQGFQPRRALLVLRLHVDWVDEKLHSKVAVHLCLAFGLREASHRVQIIRFDPVEVVLSLGVHHAEHRVGVALSVDVWDAPVVADDRDVLRSLLPGRDRPVRVCENCTAARDETDCRENKTNSPHSSLTVVR